MTTKQQIVRRLALAATAARRGVWPRDAAAGILRGAALLGLVAVIVTTLGAVKAAPTAMPVKGNAPISLYGGGAASRDDCVRRQAGDSFHWKGSGQITWKVQVDRAGDCELALNHAAEPGAVGQHVQISSGSSRVEYKGGHRGGSTGGAACAGQHGLAGQSRLRADVPLDLPELREFFKTCKAGNPNRIVALNSWIYPNVSEWQEYWAGETASPVGLPLQGTTQEHGPGAGLRYHALLIMEPYWVQQRVEMPRPRFTAQQLGDYIGQCKANGGAVTINLGIYQDGTVDPNAINVLKEVRKRIRKPSNSTPVQREHHREG